jgi:hypothetical protein
MGKTVLTIMSLLEILVGKLQCQLRRVDLIRRAEDKTGQNTDFGTVYALTTSSVPSLEITTLNHETRDNPVEMSSFVPESFG